MMSALFSIATRRVSISLYQRARYSSIVQGTLPASHQSLSPMDAIFQEGTKGEFLKQVPKKKEEEEEEGRASEKPLKPFYLLHKGKREADQKVMAELEKEQNDFFAEFGARFPTNSSISMEDLGEFLDEWYSRCQSRRQSKCIPEPEPEPEPEPVFIVDPNWKKEEREKELKEFWAEFHSRFPTHAPEEDIDKFVDEWHSRRSVSNKYRRC